MTALIALFRRRRGPACEEEGSILVLVLVIVIGVVLSLSAVLSFAQSGLNTSTGYRTYRNATYYTDGAMDGAINALRGSSSEGTYGSPCNFPDPLGTGGVSSTFNPGSPALTGPDQGANGSTYSVTCQGMPGSGSVPGNQPKYAILTLGDSGSQGISLTGQSTLLVDGGVYDNGKLLYDTSSKLGLTVNGDLTVGSSACPSGGLKSQQTLVVRGVEACNISGVSPTSLDPYTANPTSWTPEATTVPATVDPAASCATSSSIVVFQPGLYTTVPTAPTGCNSSQWWLQPGVYYFDFQTGSSTWTIDSHLQVIGGTLPSGYSSSSTSVPFPGGCVPPDSVSETPPGVQIIMGGASQISVGTQGGLEVCSDAHSAASAKQQIALYTLASTGWCATHSCSGSRTATSGTLHPASATSGVLQFVSSNPLNYTLSQALNDIGDGKTATASLTPDTSASVTTSSYDTIPSGSLINSVSVQVQHQDTSKVTVSGSLSLGGKSIALTLTNGCTGGCLDTTTIYDPTAHPAVNQLPTSSPYDSYPYKLLDGTDPKPTVTYTAHVGKKDNGTDVLDGINLIVNYTPPGFEATTCTTSAGCTLFQNSATANQPTVFFHGTVYAPTATLSVAVFNGGLSIFDRGVVATNLEVNVSASSTQLTSPFSLPQATAGRTVLFIATVDGKARLRAVATYQDYAPDPSSNCSTCTLGIPGYVVSVSNWTVLRPG